MGRITKEIQEGRYIMILPKEFFDKIEYFEHTMERTHSTTVFDKFTIHFKAWWRRKKVIKIERVSSNYNEAEGTFTHQSTPGAADLYNQLNDWATQTFSEKLSNVSRKYETNNENNVIQLKPKPQDMDNE